jgi:hypothetical protein
MRALVLAFACQAAAYNVGSTISRRTAIAAAGALGAVRPAAARPEGVNKPELLPKEQTNVIDLERFLTSGERTAIDKKLSSLEAATGVKLRVLCQSYPNTPGLAIKDYWKLDDKSIVMVVDKGQSKGGGTANILNFNVADGVKLSLPNQFWTRLQNTFGNNFFVRDNGEDVAIVRAVDTIDYCLRDELAYCVDVPMEFKNPAKAMYGDSDPAAKLFADPAAKGLFDGFSKSVENVFGS